MRFPITVFKRTSVPAVLLELIGVGFWLVMVSSQAQSAVTANPSKLAFGNVQVDQETTLRVVLTNTGKSGVTITADHVSGQSFTSDLTAPITLKAGQQITIHVTFAPKAAGMHYGRVSASNSNGLLVKVPLDGNGVDATHSVSLSWDASPSKDVAGYNVYRATNSHGPYVKINADLDTVTTYLDDAVSNGQTYYYVTTAVDSSGQESPASNRTKAVIPY